MSHYFWKWSYGVSGLRGTGGISLDGLALAYIEKYYGPFLWTRFIYQKAAESPQGESLHLTMTSPGVLDTRLINLERIKG